jgi:hypothetical protein
MNKRGKGRPPTRQIKFMDGFYIEIRNKGSHSKGVMVRSASQEGMEALVQQYEQNNKEVIVHGEHKNFEWVSASKKK